MELIYKYKTFKEVEKILTLTLEKSQKLNKILNSDVIIYKNGRLWNLKLIINKK